MHLLQDSPANRANQHHLRGREGTGFPRHTTLNPGHALVIPKEHYETIYDIPEDLNAHLHRIVKKTAIAVKEATQADGITIIQQNGKAAGQEVLHLHVHVVPRYEGQKLQRFSELQEATKESLEQTATKIKQQLS